MSLIKRINLLIVLLIMFVVSPITILLFSTIYNGGNMRIERTKKELLTKVKKSILQNLAIVQKISDYFEEQIDNAAIDEEFAPYMARDILKNIRFDNGMGFLWIVDESNKIVLAADSLSLNGTEFNKFKNLSSVLNGKTKLVREIEYKNEKYYIARKEIKIFKWNVFAFLPKSKTIDNPLNVMTKNVKESVRGSVYKLLLIFMIVFVVMVLSMIYINKTLKKNIDSVLGRSVELKKNIKEGDLLYVNSLDDKALANEFLPLIENNNSIVDAMKFYLNVFPVPIMIEGEDNNIKYVNEEFCHMFNQNMEIIGKSVSSIFKENEILNMPYKSKKKYENELEVETNNGEKYDIRYFGVPISDASGKIVSSFEIFIDQREIVKLHKFNKFVSNYQSEEINKISMIVKKLSQGFLTEKYLIGHSDKKELDSIENEFHIIEVDLNKMIGNLNVMIGKFVDVASKVNGNGLDLKGVSKLFLENFSEITEKSQTIASSSTEMESNISVIASSVEEISINSKQIATNSEHVSSSVVNISQMVENINGELNLISNDTKKINSSSEKTLYDLNNSSSILNQLKSSSDEITNFSKTIKKISEQTNLLALNATIEAASAGEYGKGFAVVANEIKELANQSMGETKNIEKIISSLQQASKSVFEVFENIKESMSSMAENYLQTDDKIDKLSEVVDGVNVELKQSSDMVNDIDNSIKELTEGLSLIAENNGVALTVVGGLNSDILDVNSLIDNNMKNVNNINEISVNLNKMSDLLLDNTKLFKLKKEA